MFNPYAAAFSLNVEVPQRPALEKDSAADPCWKGYERAGTKKKGDRDAYLQRMNQAIASLVDKDSTAAERLSGKWASPPTYAKVKIQEALRDLPQIRSLMEAGEGLTKFAWNGEIYTTEERDGVLMLVKAAKKPLYHEGKTRTDAKGRNMVFNEETRRWRVDRSESGGSSTSGEEKPKEKKSRKPKAKPAEVGGMPVIEDTPPVTTDETTLKPKKHKESVWLKPKAKGEGAETEKKVQPKSRKSKPKAEPAEKVPEKGGAIARIQGGLSTSSKQSEGKQPDKGLKGRAAIDDKYSSENPTDEDVNGWIGEAILEHTNPSDENIHQKTLKDAISRHGFDLEDKKTGKIDSKDVWAKAVYAKNAKYVKEKGEGGEFTWKNFSWYSRDGGKSELEAAQKKVASARTDSGKQKAQKKLDQLKQSIKDDRETSEKNAKRENEKINKPQKQQIAELHQQYDEMFDKRKGEAQALHEKIKKGDKKAIASVTNEVTSSLPTFDWQDPSNDHKAPVREHLQQVHRSTGGDLKTLGLENSSPDLKELKTAYRNASKNAHPDRGGSTDDFQRVNGAYERLLEKYHPDALRKSLYSFNSVLYRMDEESRSLIKCVHQFRKAVYA